MKTFWIDIAVKMVVATIAATWGVFLKRWLEKPTAISIQNALESTSQKSPWKSSVSRVFQSPRIAFVAVVFGILSAVYDYRHASVVSKRFVIEISFDMLIIAYGMFANVALHLLAITGLQLQHDEVIHLLIQKHLRESKIEDPNLN